MAVTKSNKSNITSPNGNSLALFVDINDDKLKMKDINGEVQSLDDFVSVSGGTLQIQGGALINATLQNVTDAENNVSQLQLATNATKINGNLEVASDLDVGGNTNIDGNTLILGTLEVDNTTKIKTDNVTYLDVEDGSGNNRFTISRPSLGQKVAIDYASNPLSSLEIVGSIRTFQNGTILSDVVTFRRDGQVTFSERVNVEADSLVTTQTSSVIASTTTNANMVIAPNGTGALVASIPDGTATGGNARGANAVDLQMVRSAANQVAGINSVIGGGNNNRNSTNGFEVIVGGRGNFTNNGYSGILTGQSNVADANYSIVGGGNTNQIYTPGSYSFIGSGQNHYIDGSHGFIGSGNGNQVRANYGTVSGGQSNTASTNTHATVIGGQGNTSSGQQSVSGGFSNTASGIRSVAFGNSNISNSNASVALGDGNTASNNTSIAIGKNCTSSTFASLATGDSSLSYINRGHSHGNGSFSAVGDAQFTNCVSRNSAALTTGATLILYTDGNSTLLTPNGTNRMWKVKVEFIGTITTITGTATGLAVGNSVYGESNFGFKRVGGTSSMGAFIDDAQASDNAIMDTCSLAETAGASQELALTFTGPTFAGGGSVTMRVVAKVSLVEVAY